MAVITIHGVVNDLKLVPVGFVDSSKYLTCCSGLFNFWGLNISLNYKIKMS